MYIVKAKIKVGNAKGTAEREFKYRANAIKEAARTANRGYIILDNPEMWKKDRRKEVESVTVFDSNHPEVSIDF